MAKAFGCDMWPMESPVYQLGKLNKLGTIDYMKVMTNELGTSYSTDEVGTDDIKHPLNVVNCYTQFFPGRNLGKGEIPLDYEALTLCMRKMNNEFKGMHIGLPKIGCGLAGGDWERVREIIKKELYDCNVTIVLLKETK